MMLLVRPRPVCFLAFYIRLFLLWFRHSAKRRVWLIQLPGDEASSAAREISDVARA